MLMADLWPFLVHTPPLYFSWIGPSCPCETMTSNSTTLASFSFQAQLSVTLDMESKQTTHFFTSVTMLLPSCDINSIPFVQVIFTQHTPNLCSFRFQHEMKCLLDEIQLSLIICGKLSLIIVLYLPQICKVLRWRWCFDFTYFLQLKYSSWVVYISVTVNA